MKRTWLRLTGLIVILVFSVFLFGQPVSVEAGAAAGIVSEGTCGAEGDNVSWTLSDAGTLTIRGTGAIKDYDYSSNIFPWSNTDVKEVVIEKGITRIGEYAFYRCMNMTHATLPDSLTEIGSSAFAECFALETIELPDGITEIKSNVFNNCQHLTSIRLPDTITTIGGAAFSYCFRLPKLTLPKNLKVISEKAFGDCGFTSIVIPGNVEQIDSKAFRECDDLQQVTFAEGGVSCRIGASAFYECTSLTAVDFSNRVSSIGVDAFYDCPLLAEVRRTGELSAINEGAFGNCPKLHTCPLPETLRTLGSMAFAGDGKLESVTIPGTVKAIGGQAFQNCSSLKTVVLKEGIESVGWGAFNNCDVLEEIRFPVSLQKIYDAAFSSCDALSSVYFSGPVPSIAEEAFENVTADVYYPSNNGTWSESARGQFGGTLTWKTWDSQTNILASGYCGDSVRWKIFADADLQKQLMQDPYNQGLASDQAPKNILMLEGSGSIYDYSVVSEAPWKKYPVTFLVIGEGITRVGNNAFPLGNIKSVTFPKSLKEIGTYAFNECKQLRCIRLQNTLDRLDTAAFGACDKLTDIYYCGSVDEWYDTPSGFNIFGPGVDVSDCSTLLNLHCYYDADSFDYIDDAWEFENLSDPIPLDVYTQFYPLALAMELHRASSGEDGTCAGMALTAAGSYQGKINILNDPTGKKYLRNVNKDDFISEYGVSARRLIQFAHAYSRAVTYIVEETRQTTAERDQWAEDHWDNPDQFADEVDRGSQNGTPIPFQISANNQLGHWLVAIKEVEHTAGHKKILVYDSNYPLVPRYFYLYGSDGRYTSWKYDGGSGAVYDSAAEGAHLMYEEKIASTFAADLMSGKKYGESETIVSFIRKNIKRVIANNKSYTVDELCKGLIPGTLPMVGSAAASDAMQFVIINDGITFECADDSGSITRISDNTAVSVSAAAGSSITLGAGAEPVSISGAGGQPVTAEYEEYPDGSSGDRSVKTTITGSGSGEIAFTKTNEGIVFTGLRSGKIEIADVQRDDEGAETAAERETKELKQLDEQTSYLLTVDVDDSGQESEIHEGGKKSDPLYTEKPAEDSSAGTPTDTPAGKPGDSSAGTSGSSSAGSGGKGSPTSADSAAFKPGTVWTIAKQSYKVLKEAAAGTGEVSLIKAANKKKVSVPAAVTIAGKQYNVTEISTKAFTGRKIRTVTIGKNVKKIRKQAFAGSKATKLIIKTKNLRKSTVKGSLKKSAIKTIQVKAGSKYKKAYKKIFTKKNAGKKVRIK